MAPNDVVPDADKISKESQTSTSTRRVAQLTGHLASVEETEQVNTRPQLPIDYPVSRHQIEPNRFIDDLRELKVAVVGAGLSGINAGILLPAKVPNINLTIFEKNNDVVSMIAWFPDPF
jgi:NADH dehydrogenase FAD-containing subunit